MPYLVKLQRRPRCPTHTLIDQRYEVADFACPLHMNLANAVKRLLRRIEVLKEDHDRPRRHVILFARLVDVADRLYDGSHLGIRNDVQVQSEVVLLPDGHVVPDDLDSCNKDNEARALCSTHINVLSAGSFSGMCVSGRTVLFCRLTSTHNRIWLSG